MSSEYARILNLCPKYPNIMLGPGQMAVIAQWLRPGVILPSNKEIED